ncbi:DnaJ domain-containing protein, partial [Chytriomyces sp. MP71]
MRSSVLTVLVLVLCACFALPVLAWEKEDYAIFDLIKGAKDAKGRRNDFYTVLEVPHTATPIQVSRAYRKASLELHPDKNPAPEAASLYALLTSINGVLKDKELRERYDKHRKTGIPTWRGTGYYIARYKPGLAFIISFLVVAISIGQYATQWAQFYQLKHKIETTVVE